MDELAFDPFVLGAALLYFATAGGLGLLVTGSRILSRGAAWDHLRLALAHAKKMGGAAFAPLAGGKHGEFLVLAKGKHGARIPGAKDLSPITRAALVKDKDGQTGLVVTTGPDTSCVTGLEPMTRAWAQLQREQVPVEIVFRDDEGQRIASKVKSLLPREQEMLGKWLTKDELLTDIIRGVDYEGVLQTPGSKGNATLLVTNLRVGLLAQTVLVERVGNATRTTTSLNLITYLLPAANRVVMERAPSLGAPAWLLRLELPPELAQQQKAPVLKLGPDHTGVFLPLVRFGRPTEVVDAGAGVGRVILEAIGPAIGCGILLGGLAALVAGIYYGSHHTYHGRYILPAALAGVVTPAFFKTLHLVEAWFERSRACGATASASA